MLTFGLRLRLGNDPRAVVTTTPEPIKIIRELIADPTTVITRGWTLSGLGHQPRTGIVSSVVACRFSMSVSSPD